MASWHEPPISRRQHARMLLVLGALAFAYLTIRAGRVLVG